jgi:chorismate dehydratase
MLEAASNGYRVGAVSYLNARPLIEGLQTRPGVSLVTDVPSGLLRRLVEGEVDLALCPVIDFQRSTAPLRVIPAGGIGSDGPTLTVRLFSRRPISELEEIAVDSDSHTSIALLQVVLRHLLGRVPRLLSFDARTDIPSDHEAALLIGDKVVTADPGKEAYPFQLDLGGAWREMTGLPFVFAVWMARAGASLGSLPEVLEEQLTANLARVPEIASKCGPVSGWPVQLAERYLGEILQYRIGERELQAIQLFWDHCRRLGLTPSERPLALYPLQR